MRFELMTSSLPRKRSTPELHRHFSLNTRETYTYKHLLKDQKFQTKNFLVAQKTRRRRQALSNIIT